MDTVRRGGRPVQGFALGWSRDDISAQQKTVTNMMQNISVAIDAHKAQLPDDKKNAWYALAKECLQFVSADAPLLFGVDDMAAHGASLVKQLNQWTQDLTKLGAPVANVDFVNAPKAPPPQEGPDQYGGWNKRTPIQDQLTGPVKDAFDFFKWFSDHKTALIVGGVAVGGVVVLGVLSPYARLLSAAVPRRS